MYEFNLPCKAFSVNSYMCRDRRFKTAEAKAWEAEVKALLEEHRKPLTDLVADFNSNCTFSVELTVVYPAHVYNNQSGGVSSKTIDITNFEKPLVDLLFGHILNLNDKYITKCVSRKRAGATHGIEVKLKLHSKA